MQQLRPALAEVIAWQQCMQSKIDEVMKWQQTIRPLISEMVAHHRESELARKAILSEIQLSRSNRAASELALTSMESESPNF